MIIERTNRIDEILNSKRYVSDEHEWLLLVVHDDGSATMSTRYPIDFNSIDDIDKIQRAINELKTLIV